MSHPGRSPEASEGICVSRYHYGLQYNAEDDRHEESTWPGCRKVGANPADQGIGAGRRLLGREVPRAVQDRSDKPGKPVAVIGSSGGLVAVMWLL